MARGGLNPERFEVARLSGFEIHISPYAALTPSTQCSVYGVLVQATHEELAALYSMDGVGVFHPEAVVVETAGGKLTPALCYIPPSAGDGPADRDYLDRLVAAGREYGFPDWYLHHLNERRST